jgi:hypothetical protein
MMIPLVDIFQTIELSIRFYRWDTIIPQYSNMKRNMSRPTPTVKGWVHEAKMMKFPYKHKWWQNLLRDGN